MKTEHPIQINKARRLNSHGNPVRILRCPDALNQARHVLLEIRERYKAGETITVLSRTNIELDAIRAALEYADIPSSVAAERNTGVPLHRLREFQTLINYIKALDQTTVIAEDLRQEIFGNNGYESENSWNAMLDAFLVQWGEETNNYASTPNEAVDFLYEAIQEYRRFGRTENTVYLSTVYAAKGLEFDHVFTLGNWTGQRTPEKQEEERRPYYVGMTRARKTLTLYELEGVQNPHTSELQGAVIERHEVGILPGPSDDELSLCYSLLDLSSVWIDYPAIAQESNNIRRQISKLQTGSLVSLEKQQQGNRVYITNTEGYKIGILSEAASRLWEDRLDSVRSVRIHSIITWRKDFSSRSTDDYPDEWEVPLLEVVWVK